MRRLLAIIGVFLSCSLASAQPKLTKELGEKVRTGAGTLTEQEVLKLVPGPVTVIRMSKGGLGSVDADWLMQWEESTKFEVVLIDGKVSQLTATFSDVAPSKVLTLEAFKRLKEGMSLGDVEKVVGKANSTSETIDDMNSKTTRCVWSRGREIRAYIKDGKVNGGGFIDTLEE
jgi:hypothetical protein